jgi:hypothetical protein
VIPTRYPSQLAELEGRQVSVALDDGSRLDDCHLMSAGRKGAPSLWLVAGGDDLFIPLGRVVDVWEAPDPSPCPPSKTE